jgi:transposase-like protein
MASVSTEKIPELDYQRPNCPICGLPMWLIEVEHLSSNSLTERLHFECKACQAQAVIPPLR